MLRLSLIKVKEEQLKEKRKDIYKKIFMNICTTINNNAEIRRNFCLFQVPTVSLEEISYPLDECIEYLLGKLNKLIKTKELEEVSFYKPNVIYIKWSL
jgi:hypothetical protein